MRNCRLALAAMLALLSHAAAQTSERLDPTLTVVLGDGISAGFAGFRLTAAAQNQAWPVLAVRQMGAYIAVPEIRDSGQVGVVNSYQPLRGLLPQVPQHGERALPFPFFSMNLSIPFLRAGDSLRLRPQPKRDGLNLIVAIEGDLLTSFANAILGGPYLVLEPPVLLTQAEYAAILNPSLAFIQLGFSDVAEAAVANDASRITSTASFTADYTQLLARMTATDATVIAMTVPDPTDTAYFASIDELAGRYGLSSADLRTRFNLAAGDLLTLGGMVEVADALRGRRGNALSRGSVLSASVAAAVRGAVSGYNSAIRTAAQGTRAQVFDLAGFLRQVKTSGARLGNVSVTGVYLGGFYSEDGIYPSATGHALLANAVLQFLNSTYGANFAPAAVEAP
jgi:lysophospholipase L1-like esterase